MNEYLNPTQLKLTGFYLLAFFLSTAVDPGVSNWLSSLHYDIHEGEGIALRIIVLFLTSAVVASPLLSQHALIRSSYSLMLLVFLVTGLVFRWINGQFSIWEASILLHEIGFAGDAIHEFIWLIVIALACCAAGLLLLLKTSSSVRLSGAKQVLLFLPIMIPLSYLLAARGGYWITHFSLPIKVPSALLYVIKNSIYQGDRETVQLQPAEQKNQHILLLVDESIRADYLTINNSDENTTPFFAATMKAGHWHNYGVVSAMTNCSASANLLLRTGVSYQQLLQNNDALFKQPDIFQFAQAAGFQTHYYDAQVSGSRLNNYLTAKDIKRLDRYVPIKNQFTVADHALDHTLAVQIASAINAAQQPLFVYANKAGTHFPYQKTYPQNKAVEGRIEQYRQAIRWNVDEFFKVLLAELDTSVANIMLVYTSDHGQGLGEKGIRSTHCLPSDSPEEQARVPLVVASLKQPLPGWLKSAAGDYSQFQVFSSVLRLMGYQDIPDHYPTDLSAPWVGPRYFLSGDITGRGQLSRNPFAAQQQALTGR